MTRLELANIAKLWVAFLGLIYALGFLVITFHLSAFGISSVNWLRPQYLLAGIWCLLPILWVIFCVAFAVTGLLEPWIKHSEPPSSRRMRNARYIVSGVQGLGFLFVGLLSLSYAIGLVVDPGGRSKIWGPATGVALRLSFLSLLFFAGLSIVFLTSAGPLGLVSPPPVAVRKDRWFMAVSLAVVFFAFSLQVGMDYVRLFSASVYSVIPSTFGGGRPQTVVFLIDHTDSRTSPVAADSSGMRSIPYSLLLETDSTYIVESASKSELAIEFNKDSVRGMVVLKQ